ncbi:MAG: DUF5677 domain-containing protein [Vicinamibacterales bacterium]
MPAHQAAALARGAGYARAVNDFDAVQALYPRVEQARAFRRRPQPVHPAARRFEPTVVDHDGAVIGLATKAITTHAAIKCLSDVGFGSDAMALTRVILENQVVLEWILRDGYRIDLYILSDELLTRQLGRVTQTHYAHRPDLIAEAQARADRHATSVEAVFGDTQTRWARKLTDDRQHFTGRVSIEDMFRELAQPEDDAPDAPPVPSFMRDVPYFDCSGHVHSTALALRAVAKSIAGDQVFRLSLHRDQESLCVRALRSANQIALSAVAALNDYAGLGMDDDVSAVMARLNLDDTQE